MGSGVGPSPLGWTAVTNPVQQLVRDQAWARRRVENQVRRQVRRQAGELVEEQVLDQVRWLVKERVNVRMLDQVRWRTWWKVWRDIRR